MWKIGCLILGLLLNAFIVKGNTQDDLDKWLQKFRLNKRQIYENNKIVETKDGALKTVNTQLGPVIGRSKSKFDRRQGKLVQWDEFKVKSLDSWTKLIMISY